MSRFDLLSAEVLMDLYDRGFVLRESGKTHIGSQLPCQEFKGEHLYVGRGSIANFVEIAITYVSIDTDWDDNPHTVAHVTYHSFSEPGCYLGDSESIISRYIAVEDLPEYLRNKGFRTNKELREYLEGRRTMLRANGRQ